MKKKKYKLLPVKDRISEEGKALVPKLLKDFSYYETGLELGLDEDTYTKTAIRNTVKNTWEAIRLRPEKYGTTLEEIAEVDKILESRNMKPAKVKLKEDSLSNSLADVSFEEIGKGILKTRDDALMLLRKKMHLMHSDEKELSKVNMATLATTFAILFDKSQIAKGEATQHIAVHAKISNDMTPEERLQAIYNIREKFSESKK